MRRKTWLIGALLSVALACGSLAISSCGGGGEQSTTDSSVDSSMDSGTDSSIDSSTSVEKTPTEGVVYDLFNEGTYALVTGYNGTDTDVVIADTYKGVPVIVIGANAFYGRNITSVVIPDSVAIIGARAFMGCFYLSSVEIPDSVVTIQDVAFGACISLTDIQLGENNPSYQLIDGNLYSKDGKTLVQYALGKTDNSFTIPNGVTAIGMGSFAYCPNLTSVVIGDSVTTIGDFAFYDCDRLTSVYYQGTESDWAEIEIGSIVFSNTNVTVYYYSASTPTDGGNYWHYDENGNPVAW